MEAVEEMESSACVQKVGSLTSCARNDGNLRYFAPNWGKHKIRSIELPLLHARGKCPIANALSYFLPATTMRDMPLICQETAQLGAVFAYSTHQPAEGMRQGKSWALGWAATFRCTCPPCHRGKSTCHACLKMMEAASEFPTGKRHVRPQLRYFPA